MGERDETSMDNNIDEVIMLLLLTLTANEKERCVILTIMNIQA